MEDLRGEERLDQFGRQQASGSYGLGETDQVAGSRVRPAVRRADRRIAEDVLSPSRPATAVVEHRVLALGHIRNCLAAVEEPGRCHSGPGEDGIPYLLPVRRAGDRLDRQAHQDVADIAVPAPLARIEKCWLVGELRQKVSRLDDRVGRLVDPQGLVVLAGLLVRVVGKPGRVRQQVPQRHLRRHRRASQVDHTGDRPIQRKHPLTDQL